MQSRNNFFHRLYMITSNLIKTLLLLALHTFHYQSQVRKHAITSGDQNLSMTSNIYPLNVIISNAAMAHYNE